MLDERRTAVLNAVVEHYIETAQPVGSGRVADAPGVHVSSATVRNEMMQLEKLGYLHQPHTSAGRIPTDKGYRYFVDSLAGRGRLGPAKTKTVRTFFDHAHGEIEAMLADTSLLLSDLTDCAAVVTGPGVDAAAVRSVQLIDLAPTVVLAVVILANGAVEKRTLELAEPVDADQLASAAAQLSDALVGNTITAAVEASGTTEVVALIDATVAAIAEVHDDEAVFVEGRANMAVAFEAIEQVREVLGILEQQLVVVTLIRDVLDRGLQVAIGNETGVENLADCSLVVAPYGTPDETVGTIGILGPTRMDYPQALAAVAMVSNRLGSALTEAG